MTFFYTFFKQIFHTRIIVARIVVGSSIRFVKCSKYEQSIATIHETIFERKTKFNNRNRTYKKRISVFYEKDHISNPVL